MTSRGALAAIAGFGVCLALLFGGVAWISTRLLDLEAREADARRLAAEEENVRLALWRMDSTIAPVLARESARPYFTYGAYYPAERPYDRMFGEVSKTEALVASPMLVEVPDRVLVHFQVGPDGAVTSPEVPTGRFAALARREADPTHVARAEAHLATLMPKLDPATLTTQLTEAERIAGWIAPRPVADRTLRAGTIVVTTNERATEPPRPATPQVVPPAREVAANTAQALAQEAPQATDVVIEPQRSKSSYEWQMRSRSVQQASSFNSSNAYNQRVEEPVREREPATIDPPVDANVQADGAPVTKNVRRHVKPLVLGNVREGPMFPLWLGDALVLARRLEVDGASYVQGVWLDWPAFEAQLLTDVADLVPKAKLVAASGPLDPSTGATRRLASLPVELVALAITGPTDAPRELGVRGVLAIAWAAVLVAAAAVGVLFAGTIALSERRGAFVSAVTHELRTPLTTFRMYSEMLAEGMIEDPAKRQRYVETLRREAVRLTHLVENVLAYARIERGRATGRIEVLALGDTLARITERLRDRAVQAEMELVAQLDGVAGHGVVADATALEQILFNLVDNACKYARTAADRRIVFSAECAGSKVRFTVRDHGPGIPADERHRLFSPFSKSAQRAATSAPGVGLGLALSRRLARTMRGDLVYAPPPEGGAAFRLELPSGAPGPA